MKLTQRLGLATPLILMLAVASTCLLQESQRLSAALSLGWVVLSIGQQAFNSPGTNRLWPVAMLAILLLNVRGIVLGEGPRPVSHMDYVLLIAAVLAGYRQSLLHWRCTLSGLCLAVASCGLGQASTVWHHLTGTEIGYRLGFLLINQTALLTGLGCMSGLAALQLQRKPHDRLNMESARGSTLETRVVRLALIMGSGGCGVMALATHSRAGVSLIPVSMLAAWIIQQSISHHDELLRWLWRRWVTLGLIVALVAGIPLILTSLPESPALVQRISSLYGRENRINDQGRLNLWRCYFDLPFSGSNRFVYGVGYGAAREMCPVQLQPLSKSHPTKPMSHAHNLPLQVWAESGSLGLGILLISGVLLGRRIVSQQHTPQAMALTAPLLYALLFNLVELGMFKVPLLTVLFGAMFSSALINASSDAGTRPSTGGSAIATGAGP